MAVHSFVHFSHEKCHVIDFDIRFWFYEKKIGEHISNCSTAFASRNQGIKIQRILRMIHAKNLRNSTNSAEVQKK